MVDVRATLLLSLLDGLSTTDATFLARFVTGEATATKARNRDHAKGLVGIDSHGFAVVTARMKNSNAVNGGAVGEQGQSQVFGQN